MSVDKKTLLDSQALVLGGVLYSPSSFLIASVSQLERDCNGCGAAGSWLRPPSKIYGTLIVYACIIHDWQYSKGCTIEDKDEADRVFLNNMIRLINRDSKKWYKPSFLQRRRALKYYYAVKCLGGDAFWAGKN